MATPETLTLADLAAGRFHAGDFAVLGDPVAHSLSPVMHQASLAPVSYTHLTLPTKRIV